MSSFLQLAILLAIILFAAKVAAYASRRIGQPSVFGELLMGIILGPSLLNITGLGFITDTHLSQMIQELAEIGVLLLMFLAGMELHLSDLARNTKVAAFGGILGVIVPVVLGLLAGILFGLPLDNSLFLGLTLGATSVSISAQTLMELNRLRSRVGLGLLGAAVFDDILVILLVSIMTAVIGGSLGLGPILAVIGRMMLYLSLALALGMYVLPRLVRLVSRLGISQGPLALALVILLLYGVGAELIGGMAAITGTFIAGLMIGRTEEKRPVETGMHALAYGLFVPIFFVDIGLRVNLRELSLDVIWIFLVITIFAIIGKILGSGIGARLSGFRWREAIQLGIGMVSRGEVGLIVASVGLANGLITEELFSAVIGMILITTLLTPPLLRASFSGDTQNNKTAEARLEIPKTEME